MKSLGDAWVVVDINFDSKNLAVVSVDYFLQKWPQGLTGLAPRCPQVDNDGKFVAFFDDLRFEILVGDVNHVFPFIRLPFRRPAELTADKM